MFVPIKWGQCLFIIKLRLKSIHEKEIMNIC